MRVFSHPSAEHRRRRTHIERYIQCTHSHHTETRITLSSSLVARSNQRCCVDDMSEQLVYPTLDSVGLGCVVRSHPILSTSLGIHRYGLLLCDARLRNVCVPCPLSRNINFLSISIGDESVLCFVTVTYCRRLNLYAIFSL